MSGTLLLRGFGRPPWPLLFAIATAGHACALVQPPSTMLPLLCGDWGSVIGNPLEIAGYLLAFVGPLNLAVGWVTMLLAMMPPLLGWALMHIWRSSLPRRRVRALSLFLVAYFAVWLVAGSVMIAGALLLRLSLGSGLGQSLVVVAAALLWSASPWQRATLNRGHRLMRIGIRGWKGDRDALAFGLSHGSWCVLSCWPWMLAPMVAGHWHVAVMVCATLAMLVERLAPPSRPRWRRPVTVSLVAGLFHPPPKPTMNRG